MKITNRICIIITLCICILLQCSGAYAENFVEVARDENFIVYIDLSSLKDQGEYVTVWEKWILRGKALEKEKKISGLEFAYHMFSYAYKTNIKESQIISRYDYDNDGMVLDSHNWTFSPYEFNPLVPGSIGEFLWERVMALTNH